MGCDIHGVIQKKIPKRGWVDVGEIEFGRNYDAFAILANVRNGAGFAGVPTGESLLPIDDPRGFPDGFKMDSRNPDHHGKAFMGDHSHSWVTLDELQRVDWSAFRKRCGYIGVDVWLSRLKTHEVGPPLTWSGGISGPSIVCMTEYQYVMSGGPHVTRGDNRLYLHTWWRETYASSVGAQFMDWLERLSDISKDPKRVRLVFGFDS